MNKIKEALVEEREARLFPVLGTKEAEMRVTAVLLSVLRSVKEFGRVIVKAAGGPAGKIECYTEVPLENKNPDQEESRLDGVIVSTRGKASWAALVEVKVGTKELEQVQFDKYLNAARDYDFNAIITISNQPAQPDGRPPLFIKYRRTKITLTHLSWERLLREAELLIRQDNVEDIDQQYILTEWIKYVWNPKSTIRSDQVVGEYWRDILTGASTKRLKSVRVKVEKLAEDWVGFLRIQAFRLRAKLGADVVLKLKRNEQKNSSVLIKKLTDECIEKGQMVSSLQIFHAVAPLDVSLKLDSRKVLFSVNLEPPEDKNRRGQITWILGELRKIKGPLPDLKLVLEWKWKGVYSEIDVAEVLKDRSKIERNIKQNNIGKDVDLKLFRIEWYTDIAKKSEVFSSIGANLEQFYKQVVQNLEAPPAPKIEQSKSNNGHTQESGVVLSSPHHNEEDAVPS